MRTRFLLPLAGLAIVSASVAAMRPPAAAAAACVKATTACSEFVTLGGGPGRSMIYRSYSLDAPNAAITRAVVMVHGTNRNADHYFETAMAAAFLAGAVDDTVVIAPHMIDRTDPKQDNEIVWLSSWRTGGAAQDNSNLSSFDFVDEILRKLANKKTFPNLKGIVVTRHSAGGQFANRYEMTNKVHGTLGVPITYVVANPSSYAWPAAVRPLATGDAEPATAKDGWKADKDKQETDPHTNYTFGPFTPPANAKSSTSYNEWPMGLDKLTGYVEKMTADQIRKQLVERPTTYLLGQVDTLPLGGFDSSANAMAQGPTRRARGEAFYKYVTETMGARHHVIIVPECGHNDRCMFTTDVTFPVVFPK